MKARSKPTLAKAVRVLSARAKAGAGHPRLQVPVWIAYDDLASAREGMARATELLRTTHPHADLLPMLWRFRQLDDPRWRETALRDAARASALVLAMSHESALCPKIDAWLTTLLERMRGTSVNVLALIGASEAWTITLTPPPSVVAQEEPIVRPAAAVEIFASPALKRVAACAA